jgi:hypothetical protein
VTGQLAPFPDIELVLLDLLDPYGDTVTATSVDDPPNGTIQIERIGGPDDGITDRPRVRVTVYGRDRRAAWDLTRQLQQAILAAGGAMVTGPATAEEYPSGVLLDLARTATPPRQLGEQGRNARIVESIYEFHLRRPWWQ